MSTLPAVQVFFLARPGGQRLCVYHPAASGVPQAAIVYVHPFAEEMNKSRRMAALQSRALARAGCAVLQIDLLGCGDSSGEFADAGWEDWVADVVAAADWLQARTAAPLWLWGLRAGCLLATAAAARLARPSRLLMWQPTPSGQTVLQQFLRLRSAGRLLEGGGKDVMQALRRDLAAGHAVEIAGYSLSPAVAAGLEAARLTPSPRVEQIEWLEVSSRTEVAGPSPASLQTLQAWETAGCRVASRVVAGMAFWQTAEIAEAPELIASTLRLFAPRVAEVA